MDFLKADFDVYSARGLIQDIHDPGLFRLVGRDRRSERTPVLRGSRRVMTVSDGLGESRVSIWSQQQISGDEHQQNPEHFGDEEMRHLQPDRRQQEHVHCAKCDLSCQCSGKTRHPW